MGIKKQICGLFASSPAAKILSPARVNSFTPIETIHLHCGH
jgi:hypothetical protein